MIARAIRPGTGGAAVLALVLVLVLAACAGNPDRGEAVDTQAREAARINTQLGTEYINRGQYEVALEKLKKALRADRRYAPAHTVIAILYERLGDSEQAGTHFSEALKLTPDNGEVNNNYGGFLCRNGGGDDALKYFDRALQDPFYRTPAVAMANAGVCALDLGQLDKAEAYLRKSLAYDPEFPDALLPLAGVSYQEQEYLRARGFLQRYEAVAAATAESLMLGYRLETRLQNERGAEQYRDLLVQQFPASPEAQQLKSERRR